MEKITIDDLHREVEAWKKDNTPLKEDSAFISWFIYAYIEDNEKKAIESLTGKVGGRGGEKNIDAIFIDEKRKIINFIQGKYHKKAGCSEKPNDIMQFAQLAKLPWEPNEILKDFLTNLDPIVTQKLKQSIELIKNNQFKLNLIYVTTGICSSSITKNAEICVRNASKTAKFELLDLDQLLYILQDYLDDVIPHIPQIILPVVSSGSVRNAGIIHRYDPKTRIGTWVIVANGYNIGQIYKEIGEKIFASNIRGPLGNNKINKSITDTIDKEPDNFWYFNNGITIVCDDAKPGETDDGIDTIIIDRAQIINGQQTTISLEEHSSKETNVLVKIIKIPREHNSNGERKKLINSIVRAANWQNQIAPSDLISNDNIQIYLQRELRKKGYQYIRKQMGLLEAKKRKGQGYIQIQKIELAKAIAACLDDPVIVRKGKEHLFEQPYYNKIFGSRQLSFYLTKFW